jgi:hypothetical protein
MPCRLSTTMRIAAALCLAVPMMSGAQALKSSSEYPDSKVDLYAGYGYLHPINSGVGGKQYMDVYNPNVTASVTYYFNHYIGVQAEGGYFSGNNEHLPYVPLCAKETCDQLVYTAEGGPVMRFPMGAFVPFIHILGGGERTNGPANQPLMWGWGVTGGGGIDYILPFFNKRIALRPIQADFQYSQVVYGPLVLPAAINGGFGELDALKLSGGLVVRFGEPKTSQPVMLGCSADPSTVHAGDPVTVTGSTLYLVPRKRVTYTWTANGGKVTPSGNTATIDTSGLAPGEYTVNGRVTQGNKAREQASCSAPFTIAPMEPPSITCSANPSSAVSGTTIDISTVGVSPQNRPLTYSYTADSGTITSNGPTAKLSTAGLGPSLITVTCNLVDDLGQAAKATTGVTITAPSVPVIPQTSSLCSLSFTRDTKRPVRVDNEAKGCLDDIALTLNQQADSKLVIVGNASPEEHPEAAAERSLNARQYLVQEKGIDPARIEVRVGDTSGRTVNDVLVPSGATYNNANTQLFDEKTIVRHGQAYGIAHAPAAKHTPRKRRLRSAAAAEPSAAPAPQ